MIETYNVNFLLAINIGGLVGSILAPLLARQNVTVAYMIPIIAPSLGLICLLLGTRRYVRATLRKDAICKTLRVIGTAAMCKPFEASKRSNGGTIEDSFVDGIKQLLSVIPISALTIPFMIAYSQMITVFMVQGMAMRSAGFVESAFMTNFNALSVLFFGFLVGTFLYPYLSRHGVHIAFTHKYAIGTCFGACAILAAIIVDYAIHSALDSGNNNQISILWQVFSYIFIGAGEIFAVAAVFEASFVIAPTEQKGFASAISSFLIFVVPDCISIGLYNACSTWFPSGNDGADDLQSYANSQIYNYLWVLFGISVFGVLINLFPPVKNWVESTHHKASELRAERTTTESSFSIEHIQGSSKHV